ncbi:uncharacterized protein LOC125174416 [Prionailurus viverrinus]|uniref:uncharacterized protein LOC125174416 n=1 Tax=Prionailurus viverrinus TaxID=61388 RepID=UPI001FF28C77|nr:uncharacterized protein LOC125174416 [Prionailurus viverrinus]
MIPPPKNHCYIWVPHAELPPIHTCCRPRLLLGEYLSNRYQTPHGLNKQDPPGPLALFPFLLPPTWPGSGWDHPLRDCQDRGQTDPRPPALFHGAILRREEGDTRRSLSQSANPGLQTCLRNESPGPAGRDARLDSSGPAGGSVANQNTNTQVPAREPLPPPGAGLAATSRHVANYASSSLPPSPVRSLRLLPRPLSKPWRPGLVFGAGWAVSRDLGERPRRIQPPPTSLPHPRTLLPPITAGFTLARTPTPLDGI